MKLKIADGTSLPIECATETFSILGRRNSGKSHTSVVLVEEMLEAGIQVCVLDIMGNWWALKSDKTGTKPAYPITVLGGEHADMPLLETSGAIVADFVAQHPFSCVIDTSLFSKSAHRRFVADFGEQLYRRKGEEKYKTPLHLVIEESDAVCPQRLDAGSERMFGAVDTLVRRGRSRGLGVTLISQRPQVINKDVLSQVEILICLQLTSPQDRKAVEAWVEAHDTHDKRKVFMDSLASLQRGRAWIWSPGLLDVFKQVQIRERHTFDSSATPKIGQKRAEPKALAKVDIEKLRASLAETVKAAEDNDPVKLKARIRELEKSKPQSVPMPNVEKIVRQAKADGREEGYREGFAAARTIYRKSAEKALPDIFTETLIPPTPKQAERAYDKAEPVKMAPFIVRTDESFKREPNGDIDGPQQRILNGMRWLESLGMQDHDESAVAFMAGYRVGGGAFNNPKGRLRVMGLIKYLSGGRLALTDEGRARAEDPGVELSLSALHGRVMDRLDGPERKILSVLLECYPKAIQNEELASKSGYAIGGAFNNPRGRLKTLGLVEYPERGTVKASSILFPEGLS